MQKLLSAMDNNFVCPDENDHNGYDLIFKPEHQFNDRYNITENFPSTRAHSDMRSRARCYQISSMSRRD
ncbi:MAG TPA: hypothetical protein VI479_17605 [Blastocatellia bacterium]